MTEANECCLDPDLLGRVASQLLRYPYETWAYGEPIAFDALLVATAYGAGANFGSFVHGYLRAWARRATHFDEIDNNVPGVALCECADRYADSLLADAASQFGEWLASRPTGPYGVAFSRKSVPLRYPSGVSPEPWEIPLIGDGGPAIFVDCLDLDPPFFVRLARLLDSPSLFDLGIQQALGYIRVLRDDESGLLRHFWLERTGKSHVTGWSRGQGWGLLGLATVLTHAPRTHSSWHIVADEFRTLSEVVARYQLPDGHWPVLLADSRSGVESSAAAFIAAAFAQGIQLGVLDEDRYGPVTWSAYNAAVRSIRSDGLVTNVSAAVGTSTNPTHYIRVPTGGLLPWGQAPVILAAGAMRQRWSEPED